MNTQNNASNRDHLFISYATEDGALAEWLTLKLTAEGYAVWCDRVKLLGGEPYPKDIDIAIKTRTFRFVALLSHHSIQKPNPSKERTLALNLAKSRHEDDFLIPLNVSQLQPSELDWLTSDLTFIPFQNWATGLEQLLKKLASVNAPKPLAGKGRELAASAFLPQPILSTSSESLITNHFRFTRIPDRIQIYRAPKELTPAQYYPLKDIWPFRDKSRKFFLSFDPPPIEESRVLGLTNDGSIEWRKAESIEGLRSIDLVSSLLDKSLQRHMRSKGLTPTHDFKAIFFPRGLTQSDKLEFVDYKGKNNWLKSLGERSVHTFNGPPKKYAYHLAPNFRIRRDRENNFFALLRMHIHCCEVDGKPLPPALMNRRRKKVARSWWNHHWLNRQLAVMAFLSDKKESIAITPAADGAILSSTASTIEVPFGIDEVRLKAGKVPDESDLEQVAADPPETDADD